MNRKHAAYTFLAGLALAGCPATPAVTPGGSTASGAIPAREDACEKDEDCGYSTRGPSGKDMCCNTYELYGGTKAWSDKVEAFCASRPKADCGHIPVVAGPNPTLPKVSCVAKKCRATM